MQSYKFFFRDFLRKFQIKVDEIVGGFIKRPWSKMYYNSSVGLGNEQHWQWATVTTIAPLNGQHFRVKLMLNLGQNDGNGRHFLPKAHVLPIANTYCIQHVQVFHSLKTNIKL